MPRTNTTTGDAGDDRAVSSLFLAVLGGQGEPIGLRALAESALAVLTAVSGVERAAVAFDPDQACRLDADWRGGPWCATAVAAGETDWTEPETGWDGLRALATGSGPAGMPPVPTDVREPSISACWTGRTVRVRDRDLAAVFVRPGAGADADALNAVLDELAPAMGVVFGLLMEIQILRGKVDQVGGESQAMSRLNRLQGRFVAMASHEFKAPLTSITAYADVLKSQISGDTFPQAIEFVDVIRSESNRLLRMVNRVLDFTRMEYGSRLMSCEPVDMEPLVREAVRSLAAMTSEKNLRVDVLAPEDLPRVEVDPDLIRQVLVNLLGNAVKFTPVGGRVTVSLSERDSSVAVSVVDDGPGIPPEDIHRIFREFYRSDGTAAQAEGAGLGLSIARHIVQLHGGHIEVQRREEGGSDFRFLVPKETGSFAPLADVLRKAIAPADAARLTSVLLRTIGTLTSSPLVALLLRDGQGALVPVGALGFQTDTDKLPPIIETEAWTRFLSRGRAELDPGIVARDLKLADEPDASRRLYCPLGSGDSVLGVAVVGRRHDAAAYGPSDVAQLGVLAEVVRNALEAVDNDVSKTCEALQVLLQIRRAGIPTSTPAALQLTAGLAERLDLGESETRRLMYAATLHDAGMARVEDEIVLGDSPLSWDERDEVDRHVEQGVDLMGPLLPDAAVRSIIRHHHERWDGDGHPTGFAGRDIPMGSRILAVVDAWFSLTQERPYRVGLSSEAALHEISVNAGRQFDPAVVAVFCEIMTEAGYCVRPSVDAGRTGGLD